MKERKQMVRIGLYVGFIILALDILLNYRIYYQLEGGVDENNLLLSNNLRYLPHLILGSFGFFGVGTALFAMKFLAWILIVFYAGHSTYIPDADNMIKLRTKVVGVIVTLIYFLIVFVSPFYAAIHGGKIAMHIFIYMAIMLVILITLIGNYSLIGKTILIFREDDDTSASIASDPFGRKERVFPQQTKKVVNMHSVNIRYRFLSKQGLTEGWLNLINMFRGVLIMGNPGSGKSFGTFLPAIYQMIHKGFTMVVYDFKFKALTEYAYHCYMDMVEKKQQQQKKWSTRVWKFVVGKELIPEFCVISLENPMYSERCNVFQPTLMSDFVVDALGLIKAFFIALNPSWKNKEGDFFPESAINAASAGTWGLKIYKPLDERPRGSFCTLPHLIEFMSQDVESIIGMLIKLKDQSLVNVIKPFEEAQRDGALEQLQGQMGTVRITLSRLTSPKLYYMLTEKVGDKPFDLHVNSHSEPKIICLANSGQNQGVNNIVLSLFIVQIFRFINKKHQRPIGVMLDEAVTLSFPKGTLDTLIATGRDNLCAVWVGIQDKAQMVRDFGKDAAEAMIKMFGNFMVGQVFDDTAKMISERIGDIRVQKKTTSISAEGERSFSISEQQMKAVPDYFISAMSQGTMVGMVSDSFSDKTDMKAFFGEIQFDHPYKRKVKKMVEVFKNGTVGDELHEVMEDIPMPSLPYSKYWQNIIATECEGMGASEINKYVDDLMQDNFNQVVLDVALMRADLLGISGDALKEFENAKRKGMQESKAFVDPIEPSEGDLKTVSDEDDDHDNEEAMMEFGDDQGG